ncbi:MAG: type I-E CRISPR-associated protein Cse1/CasA [Acidobacteriota bacterium]
MKASHPEDEEETLHPVAALIQEAAAGNNDTLFDHSFSNNPLVASPAQAARYLVARQAFSIGFGKSHPFYFSDSTMIRGYTVLATGASLFETLMLNLVIYNKQTPVVVPKEGDDLPAWERAQLEQPDKNGTRVRGYLDYLTWQSRRIHLIAEGDPPMVRHCQLLQNLKLPDPPPLDPFKCYVTNKEEGLKPRGIDPAKALWRDSHTLFQQVDASIKRPDAFNLLARIENARRDGEIHARPGYFFNIYGLSTEAGKAAKVTLWSCERLPLPLAYLEDQILTEKLHEALLLAESVCKKLMTSIRALAKRLLSPESDKPNSRQPDETKDVGPLARSFNAEEFFWSQLEAPFKQLLVALPNDPRTDEHDDVYYGENELPRWARMLHDAAQSAFNVVTRSLDTSSRSLKAVAAVERQFRAGLSAALSDYFQTSTGGEQ